MLCCTLLYCCLCLCAILRCAARFTKRLAKCAPHLSDASGTLNLPVCQQIPLTSWACALIPLAYCLICNNHNNVSLHKRRTSSPPPLASGISSDCRDIWLTQSRNPVPIFLSPQKPTCRSFGSQKQYHRSHLFHSIQDLSAILDNYFPE